jgi:predicted esterase
MEHHKIKVEKTAHYFTQGMVSEKVEYFWFVFHGYGQLASQFIQKFEGFDNEKHFVVAPEALNRFYWDLRKGIPAASWMTKQDRFDEISDYTAFLTTVFREYEAQLPSTVKVIFMGFSQGCATQMRWIMNTFPKFHHLILWSGLLPEDLDYHPFKTYFQDKDLHFICGDNDELVPTERINWHLGFAKEQGLDVHFTAFAGRHSIPKDLLHQHFEKYIKY